MYKKNIKKKKKQKLNLVDNKLFTQLDKLLFIYNFNKVPKLK